MSVRAERTAFGPQPGSQTLFAQCTADIGLYVGQPGSGKSYAGVLELLRWRQWPGYTGAGFRRQAKQLMGGGGLWSLASKFGRQDGAKTAKSETPTVTWPNGASIELYHAQYESTKETHDGKEYAVEFFDELPHFDAEFFWYLTMLRNRTTCGIQPYTRASAMASPDTFVHELVKPWLLDGGWPDYEQSGRVRWFVRNPNTDKLVWFEQQDDAWAYVREIILCDPMLKDLRPKSMAVIHARTEENRILMAADPGYSGNVAAMTRVERMRMQGCWEARPASAGMFDRQWFKVLDEPPHESQILCSARGYDKASTLPSEENDNPDWTRSVRFDLLRNGQVVISDVRSLRDRPGKVDEFYCKSAADDGPKVEQAFWRGPSDTGDTDELHTRQALLKVRGCGPVTFERAGHDKTFYAQPWSAYADGSREQKTPGFCVVRASWNGPFFAEVEEFPRKKKPSGEENKDDQVDAGSRAWIAVAKRLPKQTTGWLEAMRKIAAQTR
jgi:phage terminase large subunit-like protein